MGSDWVVFGFGVIGLVTSMPALWQIQRAGSFRAVSGRIVERSVVSAPWFPGDGRMGALHAAGEVRLPRG